MKFDHWTLMHRYNGLVRLNQARPFTCPECRNALKTIPDMNTEPVLWCPYDDSGFIPGAEFWGDVNAVVTEYYLE